MPYFRVKARVNGVVKRSWGRSDDLTAARTEAQAQLRKIFKKGIAKLISVEEITREQMVAEQAVSRMLNLPINKS